MKNYDIEEAAKLIVHSAFIVHQELGPGLLESIYHVCLFEELTNKGLDVKSEVIIPVFYKGKAVEKDFRLDLLVENHIILEIKAVEILLPVHMAQLLSYLRLTDKRMGFLLNFNVPLMKEGIRRMVYKY